jgi:hypothetical protein
VIGEIDIYGVLVPPLLVWTVVAYAVRIPILRMLDGFRLYRFLWHRTLVDLALLLILTGAVAEVVYVIMEHVQ